MQSEQAPNKLKKIFIAGNIASGKTFLARILAQELGLPLHHVDSIQFNSDLSMRPFRESAAELKIIQETDSWIIDGYGPLDLIHSRLEKADLVIYLDPPYWLNLTRLYWRQIKNIWSPRAELPANASELSFKHTQKLLKSFKSAHQQMRPEMLRLLGRPASKAKSIVFTRYPSKADVENLIKSRLTK